MTELHPEIIEKDGKKQFVTYEEFLAIKEALADTDDLAALRAAKEEEGAALGIPPDQVVKEFALDK